jgi:hypothetical protein
MESWAAVVDMTRADGNPPTMRSQEAQTAAGVPDEKAMIGSGSPNEAS